MTSVDDHIERSLAIAAVSDTLGIPVPTIRSWERRYGFPSPARTRGRHRRYAAAEIDQLRALRDAIAQGHSAREAAAMLRDGPADASIRRPEVDELLKAAIDLDPNAARAVLDGATESLGAEGAAVEVALPALHEVGDRWETGTCDVANEHLMTQAVRAWLARLLTLSPPPATPAPVVLACGPKELHTAGLEAFGVILARRGWSVTLLGALTPTDSLVMAVTQTRAPAAVVVAQRSVNRRSTLESIEAIDRALGVRVFYAGGAFASPASRRGVPGTYLGTDLIEAAGVIESTLIRA